MKLFLDIETYYSKADKFDLKNLSIVEFCRSPKFKLFGVGFEFNGQSKWVSELAVENWTKMVQWKDVDVVGHNIKFDLFALKTLFPWINPRSYLDTKAMAKAVLGKTVKGHSLQLLSEHFGLTYNGAGGKGTMETDGKLTLTEAEERALASYCLGDVSLTRDLFNRLAPDFPEGQYQYMSHTIEMFVEPKLQLNVPLLEKTAKEEALRRENIFKEIGIDKGVFASNKKFPELLKEKGYECPTKDSPKKKDEHGKPLRIPALALGDVEFLELKGNGNEELKALCEARIAAKSTLLETRSGKLADIGKTGNWPFDVEFSGADQTHRFSGGSGAGGNCLLGATEVLTPKGWKRLDLIRTDEPIASWNRQTDLIQWEKAVPVKVKASGQGVQVKTHTGTHNAVYTTDHRIPYLDSRKIAKTTTADALPNSDFYIPVGSTYVGGLSHVNESEVRLMAAVQADGSVAGNRIRFEFHKERKVKRLKALLEKADIQYSLSTRVRNDKGGVKVTRFSVFTDQIDLRPYKYLGDWLLNLSSQSLQWFVDETKYWDSHIRGKSWQYFSAKKENAEWMQIAAHLVGMSTTLGCGPNNGGKHILYTVNVKPRSFICLEAERRPLSVVSLPEWMYCLKTTADGFIARSNSAVFLTHNCQNFTRGSALREAVEAPVGKVFVCGDFANIELRLVAYLSKDPGLMNAVEKGLDVYCEYGSAFFGRKITKQDEKARHFAKTAVLGLGYGMGWKKFIKTVRVQTGQRITEEEAKRAVMLYRRLYAGVPRLWEMLDKSIALIALSKTEQPLGNLPVKVGPHYLVLPDGLKVRFPNLHQEKGERGRVEWVYDVWDKRIFTKKKLYGGKVLENISQGLAGVICKEAFGKVAGYVTGLVHDEIHMVVPEEEADEAASRLTDVMSVSPTWFPEIKLSAEVGYGKNWKDAK